ncbi:hypothetical protein [Actinoplanes aureus]|uniref:Uncharacterized protein n=1 Tax=Actinoplanes aureus TaxID=2792083 RepID=A0A931G2Z0_9ACTN|nr:hypothetical protein [Actinoplanes aureus]MBG0568680.1 hypothetical protein [Actinoplanes aureus]
MRLQRGVDQREQAARAGGSTPSEPPLVARRRGSGNSHNWRPPACSCERTPARGLTQAWVRHEVYGPYYGPMIKHNPHIRFFDGTGVGTADPYRA